MTKNFLTTLGAGCVTGACLLMTAGLAQAADQYPQGGSNQYPQGSGQYQQGSGQYPQGSSDRSSGSTSQDMYESREPSAAGPQGPMRNDNMDQNMNPNMDQNMHRDTYGSPRGKGSSRYGTPSSSPQWDDLRKRLGPIGGEGTS